MTEATVDVLAPTVRAAAPSTRPRWLRRTLANRSVVAGALILLAFVLAALLAGVLSTHNPTRLEPAARLQAPSARHFLGTDEFGRDVWSLVLHGSRISLLVGVTTMLLTSVGGIIVGLVAGFSRRLDIVVMRVMDGLMAFPAILLAIALIALRHILPNCVGPLLVQGSFIFAYAILAEAILGFLGVGVPPYVPSWGNVIASGKNVIREAFWVSLFPGVALTLAGLSLNLLGDGLRDLLDPRLRVQ